MFIGNKIEPQKYFEDIGVISAIISFHYMDHILAVLRNEGIIFAYNKIAEWAVEFSLKTYTFDWEKVVTHGEKLYYKIDEEVTWELEGIDFEEVVLNYTDKKIEQYESGKG